MKEVRLNVRLDVDMFDRVREQAKTEGRSVSEIVRQLLSDYLVARENGRSLVIADLSRLADDRVVLRRKDGHPNR